MGRLLLLLLFLFVSNQSLFSTELYIVHSNRERVSSGEFYRWDTNYCKLGENSNLIVGAAGTTGQFILKLKHFRRNSPIMLNSDSVGSISFFDRRGKEWAMRAGLNSAGRFESGCEINLHSHLRETRQFAISLMCFLHEVEAPDLPIPKNIYIPQLHPLHCELPR